jgi:hypothetical protein
VPAPPRRARKGGQPERLGSALGAFLRERHLATPLQIFRVRAVWPSVVGPQVAARSEPLSLRRALLTVAVADSAWLQELSFLRGELLTRLRERLPDVELKEIRLQVRTGAASIEAAPSPPPPPPQDPLAMPLAPEVSDALERLEDPLERIADRDLRRTVRRAFLANLQRKKPVPSGDR